MCWSCCSLIQCAASLNPPCPQTPRILGCSCLLQRLHTQIHVFHVPACVLTCFAPIPQGRALSELRSLEETSASLSSSIQEGTLAKRQLLDDLLEAERQIMLSERKIQLEKEMQVGRPLQLTHSQLRPGGMSPLDAFTLALESGRDTFASARGALTAGSVLATGQQAGLHEAGHKHCLQRCETCFVQSVLIANHTTHAGRAVPAGDA